MDNFLDYFSDLEKSDLVEARRDAEYLSENACNFEEN